MFYSLVTKNGHGAKHTKFIYPEQRIKLGNTSENAGNYIDMRTRFLHGTTVEEALNMFTFVDENNHVRKYNISDLKYDIKTGRIIVV